MNEQRVVSPDPRPSRGGLPWLEIHVPIPGKSARLGIDCYNNVNSPQLTVYLDPNLETRPPIRLAFTLDRDTLAAIRTSEGALDRLRERIGNDRLADASLNDFADTLLAGIGYVQILNAVDLARFSRTEAIRSRQTPAVIEADADIINIRNLYIQILSGLQERIGAGEENTLGFIRYLLTSNEDLLVRYGIYLIQHAQPQRNQELVTGLSQEIDELLSGDMQARVRWLDPSSSLPKLPLGIGLEVTVRTT